MDHPVYVFIQAVRSLLIKYAIGLVVSLHVPIDQFDAQFWYQISDNPGIPTQFIRDNMDKPWDFAYLSANPTVTLELIIEFPDRGWDHYLMSKNPNVTWEYVLANIDREWSFERLSRNPAITLEIIRDNPQYPWHIYSLAANPNVKIDIGKHLEHPEQHLEDEWMAFATFNPNVTWDEVKDYIYVMQLHGWEVGEQKYVTPSAFKETPWFTWDIDILARNRNFDLETMSQMFRSCMCYHYDSYLKNPGVTVSEICKILAEADTNFSMTEADKNFNMSVASTHVHWRDICESMSKIKWEMYCTLFNSTIFDCGEEIRRGKAARIILAAFRESISNPAYTICKQRLARECCDM
jgi:hypothetical protein